MDGECAWCGRAEAAARRIFCDDCQAHHDVCVTCLAELGPEIDGVRLVA